MKSYYLQLRIKGIEWVGSAASLLSGMAKSTILHNHDGMVTTSPVNLFFTMNYTGKKTVRDGTGNTAVLYTTFNTFGKVPGVTTSLTLNIEFSRLDGTSQVEEIDITSMFETPMVKENQWILIDHEIVITPPENGVAGGGMTPGVDEWIEAETEVRI